MIKRTIILKHGGGELANQLWNYLSIYAYSLEQKIECENHSFFEYAHFFNIPLIKNKVLYSLFFLPFRKHMGRRCSLRTRFFRALYRVYVALIHLLKPGAIISSVNNTNDPYYLPSLAIPENIDTLYFEGWLFRNPEGIIKYRDAIIQHFAPNEEIRKKVESVITPLRKHFSRIVGVHIRQGDYRDFKNGKYFIKLSQVFETLKTYLEINKKLENEVVFIIASDGNIDTRDFPGLNIILANGNAGEDLFTLAKTDIIIGSDSSYGNLAAYLGNIPHIVITQEPIDWEYYRSKTTYFPTKYCTMVNY